ncbi:MAG TPA: hypothetical protein VGR81_13310 [Candidatus Acidoferrales bacterium]|nr:hypothetical protein [Candidatus Acidoferrales bacterium]
MKHTIDGFLLINRVLYLGEQRNRPVDCVRGADNPDMNVFPPRSISLAVWAERSKPCTGINASLFVAKQKLRLGEVRASEPVRVLRQ